MKQHFENIQYLHGDAGVRIPNSIFKDLSKEIRSKSGGTNVQQVAFAYVYLITISFLYKYGHFVDLDNETYIQNGDIKELLGYNRITKTIDKIIKKDGVLDELELTRSTKDFPVLFDIHSEEKINGILLREFTTVSELKADDYHYNKIKRIVKNRNYEIKEPLFLTHGYGDNEYGTLYDIKRTHRITIKEFLKMIFDDNFNNVDFLMYAYFKSRCKGYKDNMKSMAIHHIISDIGIDGNTFYKHLNVLKEKKYIEVNHKAWKMNKETFDSHMEANEYFWKGV
jgi:hypothetical protein